MKNVFWNFYNKLPKETSLKVKVDDINTIIEIYLEKNKLEDTKRLCTYVVNNFDFKQFSKDNLLLYNINSTYIEAYKKNFDKALKNAKVRKHQNTTLEKLFTLSSISKCNFLDGGQYKHFNYSVKRGKEIFLSLFPKK